MVIILEYILLNGILLPLFLLFSVLVYEDWILIRKERIARAALIIHYTQVLFVIPKANCKALSWKLNKWR